MAKYLLLKHYRGAPAPVNDIPMDQWRPEEVDAHIRFMQEFGARLETTGELVGAEAVAAEGLWVRYDGAGRPPVTDGPFAETKEQLGGYYLIECATLDEAVKWAAKCPDAKNGSIEVRPLGVISAADGGIAAMQ